MASVRQFWGAGRAYTLAAIAAALGASRGPSLLLLLIHGTGQRRASEACGRRPPMGCGGSLRRRSGCRGSSALHEPAQRSAAAHHTNGRPGAPGAPSGKQSARLVGEGVGMMPPGTALPVALRSLRP